jgi:hypothetical protein
MDIQWGDGYNCFAKDFKSYILSRNLRYPISPGSFADELFRWVVSHPDGQGYRGSIGFFNVSITTRKPRKISFLQVQFKSRLSQTMSSARQLEEFQKWQDWISENNAKAPVGINQAFQTNWQWSRAWMETSLVRGIVGGLAFSSAVALLSLIVVVGNVVTSLFATLVIIVNICVVLALFWLLGWQLGAIEAISITVLVGLSVDYVFRTRPSPFPIPAFSF